MHVRIRRSTSAGLLTTVTLVGLALAGGCSLDSEGGFAVDSGGGAATSSAMVSSGGSGGSGGASTVASGGSGATTSTGGTSSSGGSGGSGGGGGCVPTTEDCLNAVDDDCDGDTDCADSDCGSFSCAPLPSGATFVTDLQQQCGMGLTTIKADSCDSCGCSVGTPGTCTHQAVLYDNSTAPAIRYRR